ncbi:MAG: histidine phosphatase family protein [Clostridiales bacterium]|nr:histidine phosphatase family protein [Clostridiales bacterium]
MKTYQIHFIRHALTQSNLDGRYIGHTDEPLCAQGEEQLKEMIEAYSYPFADVVFSSPLLRCTRTAELIYKDKSPIIMRELIECDFGEFEGLTANELKNVKEFTEWLTGGPDSAPLNGESNRLFQKRVCDCLSKIIEGLLKTGTTSAAIVTHGGVIMTLLAAFGIPEASMHEWLMPSSCGYTVRITPSMWTHARKFEVIREIPDASMTEDEERQLWDYYSDDDDNTDWEAEEDN